MADRIQIIKELKHYLKQHLGHCIKDVVLFGSQQYKTMPGSDYDILILVKPVPDWKLKKSISDYCYDIELKYDIILDTHILSESELQKPRGKQPIFQNAIQNGHYA